MTVNMTEVLLEMLMWLHKTNTFGIFQSIQVQVQSKTVHASFSKNNTHTNAITTLYFLSPHLSFINSIRTFNKLFWL